MDHELCAGLNVAPPPLNGVTSTMMSAIAVVPLFATVSGTETSGVLTSASFTCADAGSTKTRLPAIAGCTQTSSAATASSQKRFLPDGRMLRFYRKASRRLPPQIVARIPVRLLLQVILVVPLGRPELRVVDDLRRDRARPLLLRALDGLLRRLALLLVVHEDRRAVLRADVVALPVRRRGVVQAEEEVEDVAVRDRRRIEHDLDALGVPGAAGLHVLVARVLERAAGVADRRVDHAGQLADQLLDAPEAAARERCRLRH